MVFYKCQVACATALMPGGLQFHFVFWKFWLSTVSTNETEVKLYFEVIYSKIKQPLSRHYKPGTQKKVVQTAHKKNQTALYTF